MITTFPVGQVNDWRERALRVAELRSTPPEGWSISTLDPMKVLATFKHLRMKPPYVLKAYQYFSSGNGNGMVWALPAECPLTPVSEIDEGSNGFSAPPQPPGALPNFLEAIDGDRSPLSYLSASIAARELRELGAAWHGVSWGVCHVLDGNPAMRGRRPGRRSGGGYAFEPQGPWTFVENEPDEWQPQVTQTKDGTTVTFYIYSQLGEECISRITDTFGHEGYTFESESTTIATGGGGFLF